MSGFDKSKKTSRTPPRVPFQTKTRAQTAAKAALDTDNTATDAVIVNDITDVVSVAGPSTENQMEEQLKSIENTGTVLHSETNIGHVDLREVPMVINTHELPELSSSMTDVLSPSTDVLPTADVSAPVIDDSSTSRTPPSQAILREALMTLNAARTELEAVRANHEAEHRRREELEAILRQRNAEEQIFAEKLRARDAELISRQRMIEDLLEQQRSLQSQLNRISQTTTLNTQTLTTPHITGYNTDTPVNRLGASLQINTPPQTVDLATNANLGLGYNLKPDTYDGTTPFREYLNQFNLIAKANNWNDGKKMVALAASLRGKATGVLNCFKDIEAFDLKTLLEKLEARFGEHLGSNSYSLFQNRRQKPGEDFPTLAADIEKLTSLAYPEVPLEVQDKIACSQFITGIYHVGVRETLQLEHITSLKVALARALEVKTIKEQNRNTTVQRSIRGSQNSSSVIEASDKDVGKQGQSFNHQEWLKNLECWGCHKKGHTRSRCPEQGN